MPELVGDSQAMQLVRQVVLRAAGSPFPVLIEGESGVGKELVARAVHGASSRRSRCFCALNCAAITDEDSGQDPDGSHTTPLVPFSLKRARI